jgi:hypothetical protein
MRSEGSLPSEFAEACNGNGEREPDNIGKTSGRDERGIREEKGGISEEDRRADEKAKASAIVNALVDHAGTKHFIGSGQTREKLEKRIEDGPNRQENRSYIDSYSKSITCPKKRIILLFEKERDLYRGLQCVCLFLSKAVFPYMHNKSCNRKSMATTGKTNAGLVVEKKSKILVPEALFAVL